MKYFKSLLAIAASGLLLGACTENDTVVGDTQLTDETGSYLAFQLFLPTTSGSTRANDVFDDGTENDEYAIDSNTAYLVLFQNSTDDEENAEFCGAYQLKVETFNKVGTSSDQCTTEGVVSTSIDGTKITKDYLYGYVILNSNGMVSNVSSTSMSVSDNGSSKTFGSGTDYSDSKFSTFKSIKFSAINNGSAKNFLMTNAPVSATGGGSAESTGAVTLLAKLKKTLYKTEAEAQANPAGEVYVERAAVKVTVAKSTEPAFADKLKNANTVSVSIEGWTLGNTNTYYYNNRHVEKDWGGYVADGKEGTLAENRKYRFVSKDNIHTGVYRTYWAEDVNYDNDAASGDFATFPTTATNTLGETNPLYTTENTFDVARMVQKNTTLAVIKAKIGDGGDFYTASLRDRNYIYYKGSEEEKAKVEALIDTELAKFDSKYKSWTESNDLGVTAVTFDEKGELSSITLTKTPGNSNFEQKDSETFLNYLKRVLGVKKYTGGMAYYNIRIRHFDDKETPWSATGRNVNSVKEIYGYGTAGSRSLTDLSTKNFLGRYGVVRNNWYQIEIDGVRSIGEPVPPTPGDTPDDEVENFISLKIHVLPWAKRSQHHTL